MKETKVTYTLEQDGRFYIIKNVPAHVSVETGEHPFAPAAVDRLQDIILTGKDPKKTIETPILGFASAGPAWPRFLPFAFLLFNWFSCAAWERKFPGYQTA